MKVSVAVEGVPVERLIQASYCSLFWIAVTLVVQIRMMAIHDKLVSNS